ncbi:hypothetical protein KIL84_006387 [Mauremys mutica]|uniref:Uncharacterized protein n=1 Tax=Mauremys mutica TaxID=74926 RepID=A0A9D3WV98_9SAUR|nr:hypothetical protein KIL84_006387 [Mauremys mutica]
MACSQIALPLGLAYGAQGGGREESKRNKIKENKSFQELGRGLVPKKSNHAPDGGWRAGQWDACHVEASTTEPMNIAWREDETASGYAAASLGTRGRMQPRWLRLLLWS